MQAGLGNGVHAFQIPTPASLKNGQSHILTARIAGSSYLLNTSPKTISGCYASTMLSNQLMNARVASKDTSALILSNAEVSLRTSVEQDGLTVYPNPSSGIFSLSFASNIDDEI